MSASDWGRPHFETGGGDAFVFYVIYGGGLDELELSAKKYRTHGLPEGVEAFGQKRGDPGSAFELCEGLFGDMLAAEMPAVAESVKKADRCTVVRGEVSDPPTLEFLRDTIGVATALLDRGAALLDAQAFRWFDPKTWRAEIFEPDAPAPNNHVTILESPEEDGLTWVHTRGMRKFGRPDLSVRAVPAEHRESVHALVNRLIELQALGGVIPDTTGSLDDPEFNNVHVELSLPED